MTRHRLRTAFLQKRSEENKKLFVRKEIIEYYFKEKLSDLLWEFT